MKGISPVEWARSLLQQFRTIPQLRAFFNDSPTFVSIMCNLESTYYYLTFSYSPTRSHNFAQS
ncbi:MAG TPA: hypothetical protein V6C85_20725 [Allocoleopsis sp.]